MQRKELKKVIKEDSEIYFDKEFIKRLYKKIIKNEFSEIGKYVIISRKAGFYRKNISKGALYKLLCLYYNRKKNILGQKLNIYLMPNEFGHRIRIYHGNIIINGNCIIGDDCTFYGNNCLGNKGKDSDVNDVPSLGNNVSVGVGTKIIGKVKIYNNVKISAMSLVNKSIEESGILVGGIPAKKIKNLDK